MLRPLLAIFASAPASADQPPGFDALFAQWSSPNTPGCAVRVSRDGRTILERAYGFADLEHDVPNRTTTIFEAGSVSKQFTATAILMLAEQGKLSLQDEVEKWVPELPDYKKKITLDHLLSHTSGLRDWGQVVEIGGWPRGTRAVTQADVLDIASRQKSLNHDPGAEYSYTNTGYNLLAIIVERASGSSLAAFTQKQIFEPLGMRDTSWRDDFRRVVKNRAIAYEKKKDHYVQEMPFEDAHGNGGLLTTIHDLSIWNDALTQQRLGAFVNEHLHRRAMLNDGRQVFYARGLVVGTRRGLTEIHHAGATGGYRAWLARLPEERLSIALLCNASDVVALELGHKIVDQFLPPRPETPALPFPKAAESAGLFVNERTGMPIFLVAEADRLRVRDGPFLEVLENDRLRTPAGEVQFKDPDHFLLDNTDGETIRFAREKPATPTPRELARLTGRYTSDEANTTLIVSLKDGRLQMHHERRPHAITTLTPAYRDVFQIERGIVRFSRDRNGKVTSLGIGLQRVRDLRFTRVNRGA